MINNTNFKFSYTVSPSTTLSFNWGHRETYRLIKYIFSGFVKSRPNNLILSPRGLTCPDNTFNIDDFPAPETPSRPSLIYCRPKR